MEGTLLFGLDVSKTRLQEATSHPGPLVCLKSKQTNPPGISRVCPINRRFLLKRFRDISFSFYVGAPFQNMSSEDFPPQSAETP
jgi:hypothetical protein